MASKTNLRTTAETYMQHLCLEIPNRRVGSEGNRDAANYFAEIISGFGFETEYQEFDCMDWSEDGARITVGGEQFEAFVSPYSLGTDIQVPFIPIKNVEQIEQVEAEGKVLLLHGEIVKEQLMPKSFPFYNPDHHKHIVATLESKSPLAIISATSRDPALAGGMYPFPLIEDGDFNIPSVFMTDEEGKRLLKYAGKPIHLESHSTRRPAKGCNVIARKPEKARRRVVLTAHIDSKDNTPGALDNATGVAILLLLSELLQDYEGEMGLELVAINGEDYYSAIGEVKYLERNKSAMDEIQLNINMDGVGFHEGATAYSFYECPDEVRELIHRSFSTYMELGEGEIWYSGDHMIFVQSGVPAVAITSEHGMTGLAQISHTPKDQLELVDCSKLVTTAFALRDLLLELNQSEVWRPDFEPKV